MIVAYFSDGIYQAVTDMRLFTSVKATVKAFREYANSPCVTTSAGATLYYADADMVLSAIEYQDIGCPFDYPDKVIEIGPRGGIRVTNA